MTGIIAKLIGEIERSFADNEKTHEGTAFVDSFLEANNIHRTVYQGSHSFEGNHGRQLLRVINRMRLDLEDVSEETDVDKLRVMRIIDTIQAFDWVTVKAHLVIAHIIPQINKRHPGYEISVLTEQSFEMLITSLSLSGRRPKSQWTTLTTPRSSLTAL